MKKELKTPDIKILHIDSLRFDDKQWESYFDFRVRLGLIGHYPMNFPSASALKGKLLPQVKRVTGSSHFVTYFSDELIGWFNLRLNMSRPENPDGELECNVIPDQVTPGLAKAVADELARAVDPYDCTVLHFVADSPCLIRLADFLMGKRINRMDRYRLYRNHANDETIDHWLSDFPRRFPAYHLTSFNEVPASLTESYLTLFNQALRDMPEEEGGHIPVLEESELRRRERIRIDTGVRYISCVLLNENERVIAFSAGAIAEASPASMWQSLTGVDVSYRGQGLSKWVKGALYRKTGEQFSENEYLTTEMRSINVPILKINDQMGFELLARGFEYEIWRDSLGSIGFEQDRLNS